MALCVGRGGAIFSDVVPLAGALGDLVAALAFAAVAAGPSYWLLQQLREERP